MKPRGLSIRLAMLMVIATVLMQVAHGLYRFSVDVPMARERSMGEINNLVTSLQPALSESLYQYNEHLSEEILKTFRAYDAVQAVWLLDSDGTGIGVWVRVDTPAIGTEDFQEVTWPLQHQATEIGSLVILMDMSIIEHAAIVQVWHIIAFSALIGLLALVFLYIIAQALVTKPIESLSRMVNQIDSHEFTQDDINVLDNINTYYEIESLKLSIKDILSELLEHLVEHKKNVSLLQKFNQTLEQSVKERTFELEQAKEKAEVANRAKTDFLNVITHELRTPLNGVLGFSSILKGRDLAEKDKQMVEGIEHSGQGLLLLLNDIIDFIDLDSKPLAEQTLSVYDALASSFNEIKTQAEQKQLDFQLDVDKSLILKGDPRRLSILARQLLTNGIKFTESGSVILRCEQVETGGVLMTVEDTGVGMSDEQYERLCQGVFNQLEQGLNRSKSGLGLGLAIVNRICSKWGAQWWIEKNVPQGTKVLVQLKDIRPQNTLTSL